MHSDQIPVITLRGTASERGRQHGMHLHGPIMDAYASLRASTNSADWDRACMRATPGFQALSAVCADMRAELDGMAAATGLTGLDVYLLSAFEFFIEGKTGCTSAGIARDEGVLVAQNWDAPAGTERHLTAFIHEGPDSHILTIASPGTLGWVGMNRHGLAFVNNDLLLDTSHVGLPSLVIRRMMLQQSSADAAIAVLRAYPHMSGRCFLVGDANGTLRVAELGPSVGVTDRAVRSVVHTNHPLFPKPAMWEDIEAGARHYPSSRARLRAARQFALTGVRDLEALLRDRSGAPDAISKSPSSREQTATAFSAIFDCGRREAMIAIGRPDQAAYRRIGLRQPAGA
ncbi:C45 family autoproteolytic acyltransferase/hydolase [Rhizobium tumorigenes]|uniref:C45 family autoproteolytic acyltransferase/hydolase n=1 Tax=Rhizobium tumorigenes TaxID=2041385 RepID=UPI00241D2022|nr:C45 family peptidase [Rhizobium tumorigenes]WFS03378.1 C45 family autoproteolytic acyltransferase/hydrolase [Rhizobium tumorigenes]